MNWKDLALSKVFNEKVKRHKKEKEVKEGIGYPQWIEDMDDPIQKEKAKKIHDLNKPKSEYKDGGTKNDMRKKALKKLSKK